MLIPVGSGDLFYPSNAPGWPIRDRSGTAEMRSEIRWDAREIVPSSSLDYLNVAVPGRRCSYRNRNAEMWRSRISV